MKKTLLLAAAAFMAVTANAEVFPKAGEMSGEDITPAGYKFNTYDKEFIGAPNINGTPQALPWQLGNNWYLNYSSKEGFEFGDGLIGLSCPNYTGPAYSEANYENFNKGCKIIDMGGTCGKVLAMNFAGSEFPEAYKALTENDLEIGQIPTGYTTLNFWFNPETMQPYAGIQRDGEDYMPMRVRVELNIFANSQGSEVEVWKAFMQNDNGNVVPMGKGDNDAPDICVKPSEFAYRWCEKSDDPEDAEDDSTWDGGETAATWNPERWMVYEWDFNAPDIENEGDPFCNIKMKNEIPGGANTVMTVLIRSINVYVPEDANREYVYGQRPRTWNYYTVGEDAGLKNTIADADNFKFNVNGSSVSFSAPAKVYSISGAMVAEGTNVNLAKGVYVAQSGNKAVKLIVK